MAKIRTLTIPTLEHVTPTSRTNGQRGHIQMVQDITNRTWYSKDVSKGGGFPLAQELLGHLTGRVLNVPVQPFAIEKHAGRYRFLSLKESNWVSLDSWPLPDPMPAYVMDDLYRIEALLGVYKIGDNHIGNFLFNTQTGNLRKIDMEFMFGDLEGWRNHPRGTETSVVYDGINEERRTEIWDQVHAYALTQRTALFKVIDIAAEHARKHNSGFDFRAPFNFTEKAKQYLEAYLAA